MRPTRRSGKAANGDALLSAALAACIQPGIGLAGATKLLHLKRPRLVPILDRLVAEMMGVNLPGSSTVEQRVANGLRLATAIRREGRRNIKVLQRIQTELAESDIDRPLIRIFEAVLWFSHPAASVPVRGDPSPCASATNVAAPADSRSRNRLRGRRPRAVTPHLRHVMTRR